MFQYGIRNAYRPSKLAPHAYGWGQSSAYNRADVPTNLMVERPSSDQFLQQFAYEWFQSSQVPQQYGYTNPPFVTGAAGRVHPSLQYTDQPGSTNAAEYGRRGSATARILRGYIRRAATEADEVSKARLYFMYNPEVITRDYVSYLDQAALDPFNTVFQSGNLVAPPSYMDFSFSLFFDRQEEAQASDHPGVFVDYQFFDMVVRNVVPTDPNQVNNTLPDNGVMMVNPRDITVVFSPQITVQGRPLNARVSFQRFTHRMVPTRMQIDLTMRAVYFGPVKDQVEYLAEQAIAQEQVSVDMIPIEDYDITYEAVEGDWDAFKDLIAKFPFATGIGNAITEALAKVGVGGAAAGGGAGGSFLTSPVGIAGQLGTANDGNHKVRLEALSWGLANVMPNTIYTGANSGADRYNLPYGADCSGLVTACYINGAPAAAKQLGWEIHPGTGYMLPHARQTPNACALIPMSQLPATAMLNGDVMIRDGHVGILANNTPGAMQEFSASGKTARPQVGLRNFKFPGSYTHVIRATPLGSTSSAARSSAWNSSPGMTNNSNQAI